MSTALMLLQVPPRLAACALIRRWLARCHAPLFAAAA